MGDKWSPKNFVSTSFNFDTAMHFGTAFGEIGSMSMIILPKKTPYLLLPGRVFSANYGDASSFEELLGTSTYKFDEMELLINKNSVFELIKVKKMKLAPSGDFYSKTFKQDQYLKIFTLRLVLDKSAPPTPSFNKTAEDIANTIGTLSFSIAGPPPLRYT